MKLLCDLGGETNFTGMMDVDFVLAEGRESAETSPTHILELNPRFSGGVHASLGSGFLSDYMGLLWSCAHGVPDGEMPNRDMWPIVRSDDHTPRCTLRDYNLVGFYARHIWSLLLLRSYCTCAVSAPGRQGQSRASATSTFQ